MPQPISASSSRVKKIRTLTSENATFFRSEMLVGDSMVDVNQAVAVENRSVATDAYQQATLRGYVEVLIGNCQAVMN